MSKRTREKKRKAQSLEQLAKPDEMSIGRKFAQPYAKARLLIGPSHSFQAVKRILLFGLYWNGPKNRPARIYSENRTDPYLCLDWWNF